MDTTKNKNETDVPVVKKEAELRVGSKTSAKALAGSITATMKIHGYVTLRAIGDGAIGASMRATAIARGYLSPIGIEIVAVPSWFTTEIQGTERTGLEIKIENRETI